MTPAWFRLGVVVCRSGVWGGRGVAGGRCCTGWGFVGEGGMLVPLLTTVAFCPCGAHASASAGKPRIHYPQTMKVGWCSAVLMWEMEHSVRGRRITIGMGVMLGTSVASAFVCSCTWNLDTGIP